MKQHLPVLDGLRGIAALSVLLFHFQYLIIGLIAPAAPWFRHAYLAVDFFFCLSGYVIAYTYDDRRDRMSPWDFFLVRLIRLHPMVILGALVGLAVYTLDPFNNAPNLPTWMEVQNAPFWKLVAATVGGVLMLPTWGLPNRMGSYFSLNGASWSLMWEYIANIAFALVLWRLNRTVLAVIVVAAAVGVGYSAHGIDYLWRGYAWGQMSDAFARTAFSFCAGVLLFRSGVVIRSPFGFGSLSVALGLIFFAPHGPFGCPNWLYESLVVIVVFPLIIAVGAGGQTSAPIARLCDLFGRTSYPVYILHSTVIPIWVTYYWTHGISPDSLPWVIAGLMAVVVLVSYAALILYDEPVRRWLKRKLLAPKPPRPLAVESGALPAA